VSATVKEFSKRSWMLVLGVAVLFASPWQMFALSESQGGKWNVIAIPVYGGNSVYPGFLRTPEFAVIDVETGTSKIVPNPFQSKSTRAALKCARLLTDEQVGVVILREVGPESFSALADRGIAVYLGDVVTVQDAIMRLQNGMLAKAVGPTRAGPAAGGATPVGLPVPAAPVAPAPVAGGAGGPGMQALGSGPVAGPFLLAKLGMEVVGSAAGVGVHRVYPSSNAAQGGVREGDLVVGFNRTQILDLAHFVEAIAAAPSESTATVQIFRQGQVFSMPVAIGEGEMETAAVPNNPAPPYAPTAQPGAPVAAVAGGVPVGPGPMLIKQLGMEVMESGGGVRITGVMGNSHAARAGLRAGDMIGKLGGREVMTLAQFQGAITSAAPESNVAILVVRDGLLLKLGAVVGEGEMEGATPIPGR
jgi:predicted Fe-Mo cluster-binding NifX family protein